ncbi:MAG: peptide chain release factor N(5)-glutamine methyltransferase [Marinobacter sp.]|uniref:peptide chain release factor N(5)-glutamine methyltransferase n=1 Tax=Marinobacter sp. TaxID=50741 RepID=UPI001B79434B|nr:peptide chain release factor N(5)-glutamine methyltransferase [Marinobacter sp.]MBQ0746615.1 peptide chain release factor N(5)-glutamine methyltransferase [Marinobacter sp.]MBQ0813540.1 peptide chain release factor N(5)-glutamine methyltransferase [Marinobacter sp.]|tara:strand:- start:302 stop:1168 length:867 start_codon:yes stop_codon:yes gene_type:complete
MTSKPLLTCEALLSNAVRRIAGDTARLDAELLLAQVTGLSRSGFRAFPEREVEARLAAEFEDVVTQRAQGMPVAYLLGHQEFWSLPFKVSSSTLIPRPDTECLVEQALELPLPDNARVVDLGTGTGAIALALASERPSWMISACDLMEDAVALAQANASKLKLPVEVFQSRWFAGLPAGSFDLIVSNPPYVASGDHHLDEGDVRFEPASALVSGADGLDDIRLIVSEAPAWLNAEGWLLLEHGFDQAEAVQGLLTARGFAKVESRKDYGGNDRMTLGQWPRKGALHAQ